MSRDPAGQASPRRTRRSERSAETIWPNLVIGILAKDHAHPHGCRPRAKVCLVCCLRTIWLVFLRPPMWRSYARTVWSICPPGRRPVTKTLRRLNGRSSASVSQDLVLVPLVGMRVVEVVRAFQRTLDNTSRTLPHQTVARSRIRRAKYFTIYFLLVSKLSLNFSK